MQKKEIKILNKKQAYLYMKNGVSPIRVEVGKEDEKNTLPIVFVFEKNEQISRLYGKWLCRELK